MKSDLFKIIRAAGYVVLIVVWFFLMLAVSGCSDDEDVLIFAEDEAGNVLDSSDDFSEPSDLTSGGDGIVTDECEKVVVFVCGAVERPGVYELLGSERVSDAILLAGGFAQNAAEDYLNLAQTLSDGVKIYVPTLEELAGTGTQAGGVTDSGLVSDNSKSLVNINTASKEELMTLPGVGESKADKIIAYRENYGGFASNEDIMQVSGIKEGMYNKICDRICTK